MIGDKKPVKPKKEEKPFGIDVRTGKALTAEEAKAGGYMKANRQLRRKIEAQKRRAR